MNVQHAETPYSPMNTCIATPYLLYYLYIESHCQMVRSLVLNETNHGNKSVII